VDFTLAVKFENDANVMKETILKGPSKFKVGNDKLEKVLDSIETYKEVLDEIAKVCYEFCAFCASLTLCRYSRSTL
jgi:hypothetical protein